MKRFVIFGLAAMSGCAPAVVTNQIQLNPANQIALLDGTPIARLTGYPGNPRATVSFIFADGDSLMGDALMHGDIENGMGIWGQHARSFPGNATLEMVAIDDRQTMHCRGIFGPQSTHIICNLSDGAIYRDDYTAPSPRKSG